MTRKIVQVGDLIRVNDWKGGKPDERGIGTVLQMSEYKPSHKLKYQLTESLSEILWQDGKIGWILTDRLEILSGDRWKD